MTVSNPGFADPVLDSQACFRAVLDAMARPGTVHTLATPHDPPAPLHRATAAVLLTLIDVDTPLWLDTEAMAAADWIAFHCGAPAAALGAAAFAVALAPISLAGLRPGSDAGPEEGATLIQQVAGFDVAGFDVGPRLRLSGPGLEAPKTLQVEGLLPGFVAEWAANHACFPRGVDLILCAGDRLVAFPRTLRIQEA